MGKQVWGIGTLAMDVLMKVNVLPKEDVFDRKEVQLLEQVNHISFEKLTDSIEKAIAQIF